ncbi:Putative UDP-N-acetylmuramyl pentapeptide phosphotransferase [Acidilobus saccharovorans 345-15]|uniref:Putative UDP-N-acetylmuramyl pentapeptide phosphotransferase n=1 Tax=Acidilobus saccharovorans (strain DSM 16705 / JCM 18335 / VKM B-2471 / 345-15) TaxID=666510 RepID=D9PZI8_ACIS3|nr:glycosyltransferase 4 family protein [Acidilobus saccharovorans]ADL18476.1 Putative UDP-N-acetylmuramyl pentapeptide phosphotransferase [Acidilobus saccharovorans 345-15]
MLQEAVVAVISSLVAMGSVMALEPSWIAVASSRGLVGSDMNKPDRRKVAEAGGLWVIVGASLGLLVMEAINTFVNGSLYNPVPLFSMLSLLMLTGLIGLLDDILGWKKGIPPAVRVLSTIPAALPLMIAKYNAYIVHVPILHVLYLGLLFPLVVVPVGVMGASNAYNMIAGYNGLEAGMGVVMLAFTAAFSIVKGLWLTAYLSLIMMAALLGFLFYNWYPAKVFPGNTMTYAVGAYYAGIVVLGDIAAFGLFMYMLYYAELLLFIRGLMHGVYKENFGRVRPDGSLEPPYDRSYSLTHLMIRLQRRLMGRATERGVTVGLMALQAVVGAAALLIFLRLS